MSQGVTEGQKLAMRRACGDDDADEVRYLLRRYPSLLDANVKRAGESPETPLYYAARRPEATKALLQAGANTEIGNREGSTPLHCASIYNDNVETIQALLAGGANVDATNYYEYYTPLHLASIWSTVENAKVLMAAGANLEATDNEGRTPLHIASEKGWVELTQVLMEEDANVEATDNKGRKPGDYFGFNVDEATQQHIKKLLASPPQRVIKCKYEGDAARFSLKKTTTLKELIGMVEGEWGEGKGLKFQDEDGDWLKMKTNNDVLEVWKQTKKGAVSLKVFSTQQNQTSRSSLPSLAHSSASSASSTEPTPPSTEIAQPLEIGWETSTIPPPARCFKRSPQLNFEQAIRALLLGLEDIPPGRSDLFEADGDDVDSLISRCEYALSQMATHGSDEVKEVVRLLTRDEALVILAYTCEDPYPVYRWLNAWLVHDRRDPLVKSCVGPFFRLLYQGLEKLPPKTVEAGRGVLVRDIAVLRNCFDSPPSAGASISFWGVSSFSLEDNVASEFGGGAGDEGILYSCGNLRCVLLGRFSMTPREAEVLPLPPSVFKVNSTFRVNEKKLVISLDHDQAAHARFAYV